MALSGLARCIAAALVGCNLLFLSCLSAAEKSQSTPPFQEVELFSAMDAGEIEVRLVPKDSQQATVVITNKTQRPLSVRLPAAFAGVPVLAQQPFLGGANNFNNNQFNNGGANQAVGGGFNQQGQFGQGNGNPFGNQPNGIFNVEPEKSRKLKVSVLCLEHGKKDPHVGVKYQIIPIASYTKQPEVQEVCRLLGGGANQPAAQAAAWHLANGKSWSELTEMLAAKHLNGRSEVLFSAEQLLIAKKIARLAQVHAEQATAKYVSE